MNITLNLNQDAVQFLLTVLSEIPTGRGVYPLAIEIKTQTDNQIAASKNPTPQPAQPAEVVNG